MKRLGFLPARVSGASPPGPVRTDPATGWDALLTAARARLGTPSPLRASGDALFGWCAERGADPGLRPKWEALLRGEGLAVVTGQQPAMLGGPLYTLYKAVTAAVLARRLEQALGVPAVAVFWLVGDDADFGEVASGWLPGAKGALVRVRAETHPPGGTMIGGLPAGLQVEALAHSGVLAGRAHGQGSLDLLVSAAGAGTDWSGCAAGLLFRLLPGLPLLAIDGAHPAVTGAQTPWLARARDWPLPALLQEGAEEARACGHDPALDPESGERAVYALGDGTRKTLMAGADGPLAPNVVLRPVLQDLLLPNAATVCGTSEIRYRAQLGPVYRNAGIPHPPLPPRLKGLLVPGLPEDLLAAGGGLEVAASDPEGFIDRLVERSLPQALLDALEKVRERLRGGLGALEGGLRAYDASLTQLLESSSGKADFQLGRLREGVLAKGRQKLYRQQPLLAHWSEFLRPRNGEQERTFSLLTPFLLEGSASADVLADAAEAHLRRVCDEGLPEATALFGVCEESAG